MSSNGSRPRSYLSMLTWHGLTGAGSIHICGPRPLFHVWDQDPDPYQTANKQYATPQQHVSLLDTPLEPPVLPNRVSGLFCVSPASEFEGFQIWTSHFRPLVTCYGIHFWRMRQVKMKHSQTENFHQKLPPQLAPRHPRAMKMSQSSRQLLYRYIIHARPHLTAKVFRYLKTLIGKAAIDRGFLRSQAYISQLSKSVNQPTSGRNHTQYFDLLSYCRVLCFN